MKELLQKAAKTTNALLSDAGLSLFLLLATTGSVLAEESLVRLQNGKELRGALLNREITLHARYGSVTLKADKIAEMRFAPGFEADSIMTTTGNRLSGFINDAIQFQANGRESMSLRPLELESLRMRSFDLTNSARSLVLVNGDVLGGEFDLPTISVTNATGAETISSQKIDSIWLEKNEALIKVLLIDGKEVPASLTISPIRVHLDVGGDVEIPRALLRTIYWRPGHIPPEMSRVLAGDQGQNTNAPPPMPAPPRMAWIRPGAVMLGSPLDERGRNSDEDPRTRVTISRGFWIGQYEVTQGEYAAVMGINPSTFQGDTNRPVEKVSWYDANDYCARLTEAARERGTLPAGYVYRLPTEAEWEYACRAGTTTRFSFGDDPDERELSQYAWFVANSNWTTHPVGQLRPNPWGLYDMHGNVLELCAGLWSQAYPGGQVTDYKGASEGWLHAARGGSWLYNGALTRSANRDDYGPSTRCSDLGFRVVLGADL